MLVNWSKMITGMKCNSTLWLIDDQRIRIVSLYNNSLYRVWSIRDFFKDMFLSLVMFNARICLFSGSIATHNQMYSELTFNMVSSTMYSDTLLSLDFIFFGRYFWIQFQMDTWFRLTKHESLSEARLRDKPEKYKYKP